MSKTITITSGYGVKISTKDFKLLEEKNYYFLENLVENNFSYVNLYYSNQFFIFPNKFCKFISNSDGVIDLNSINKPENEFLNEPYLLEILKNVSFEFGFFTTIESY